MGKWAEEDDVAFDILERLTEELDLVYKATEYPWKVRLTKESYDRLKKITSESGIMSIKVRDDLPQTLIYGREGHEYLRCFDNHNIPFIIHARIADTNSDSDEMMLDDFSNPNIEDDYRRDYEKYLSETDGR